MIKNKLTFILLAVSPVVSAVAHLDWSALSDRTGFYVSGFGELGCSQNTNLDSGSPGMDRDTAPVRRFSVRYKRPVLGGGLGLGYFKKMFRLEHIWGYRHLEDKYVSEDGVRLHDGRSNGFKMNVFSSVNTLYLDIPLHARWLPFVGIGGGFCVLSSHDTDIPSSPNAAFFDGAAHIELCGELTAGLTYKVSDRFSTFGSYVFFLTGKTFDASHSNRLESLRNHSLRFGLSYVF